MKYGVKLQGGKRVRFAIEMGLDNSPIRYSRDRLPPQSDEHIENS